MKRKDNIKKSLKSDLKFILTDLKQCGTDVLYFWAKNRYRCRAIECAHIWHHLFLIDWVLRLPPKLCIETLEAREGLTVTFGSIDRNLPRERRPHLWSHDFDADLCHNWLLSIYQLLLLCVCQSLGPHDPHDIGFWVCNQLIKKNIINWSLKQTIG